MMELMKARRTLTEAEVRYYMVQILDAVEYLHERQIIHRDLKLGNLFLDKDMHIKVGDFGLACQLGHHDERKKTICGTPNYIAPEVLQGGDVGHSYEVDIWSIGCIFYTVLFGKPPFQTRDVKTTYSKIKRNEYAFPPDSRVSTDARELVRWLLQPRPSDRPSIAEIRDSSFFRSGRIYTSLPSSALSSMPPLLSATNSCESGRERRSLRPLSANAPAASASAMAKAPLGKAREAWAQPQAQQLGGKENASPAAAQICRPQLSGAPIESKPPVQRRQQEIRASIKRSSDSGEQCEWQRRSRLSEGPPGTSSASTQRVTRSTGHAPQWPPRSDAPGAAPVAFAPTPTTEPTRPAVQRVARSEGGTLHTLHRQLSASLSAVDGQLWAQRGSVSTGANESGAMEVDDVLARAPSPRREEVCGGAERVWVSSWIDYSQKYGMGYLLCDGSVGVYFNDATMIVLESAGKRFEYTERKTRGAHGGESGLVQQHTMDDYPDALRKKVTLLRHFQQHLVSRLASLAGLVTSEAHCCSMPLTPPPSLFHTHSLSFYPRTQPQLKQQKSISEVGDDEAQARLHGSPSQGLIYVKKWLVTRHCMLFRLSNHTVQVVFNDQSELVLSSTSPVVTYVEKSAPRCRHHFTLQGGSAMASRADVLKRLKYTREILARMISNHPR